MVGVLLGCQTLGEPKARPTGDAPSSAPASAPKRERAEADLLSNVRQLIFDGRRSGEGYFSKDGRQLIFQSEREASNPFYQIYRLDLETGDTERVSPGIGKTTCSWVHRAPDGRSYLFSSTHEDPDAKREMKAELAFRASGKTRRYSWDYDEYFDIYRKDGATGAYVNLTNTRGYDAEASYAPDGAKIAFASNRRAYAGAMSDADKKAFARDPAYMMDIYIMDADGAGVTRLTEAPGYDGGPFFSPDGQRIVWRRFNPEGDKAEVWSMKLDGSDKRAITRLEHMSWAPYYHPSGDYLIFTTNVHGFNNFELYMVDAEGTKKPVRVTFTPGWDGLPVFSPDGRKLAWSTGRTEDKKPQIFLADWDDGAARELLSLSPGRDEVAYRGPAADVSARIDGTTPKIVAQDVRRHVDALTDPAMNGRLTGTPGEARATAYVASAFAQLGLQPAGDGGWFQPFEFTSGVTLGEPNVLLVQAKDTTTRPPVDEAWRPLAFSKPGSFARRRLVFAGYGVVARAADGQPAYDAYGDLDVKDKMVVVLRYLPKDIDPDRRAFLSRFASLRYKAMEARDRGAKGLIVVTGPSATAKQRLVPLRFDAAIAGTGIPAISVSDAVGAEIFARAGHDLKAAQAALDGGRAVAGFALPGTQIGGHLTLNLQKATGRNVVGRLQVGDARSDQVVVIGAHVDHLGRGDGGDSLAKPEERGQIHPGADDNASGVAGLLEIAQSLAHRRQNGSLAGARRDVVFAAWSGEELGLYGSTHWVKAALRDAPSANGDAPSAAAEGRGVSQHGHDRAPAAAGGLAGRRIQRGVAQNDRATQRRRRPTAQAGQRRVPADRRDRVLPARSADRQRVYRGSRRLSHPAGHRGAPQLRRRGEDRPPPGPDRRGRHQGRRRAGVRQGRAPEESRLSPHIPSIPRHDSRVRVRRCEGGQALRGEQRRTGGEGGAEERRRDRGARGPKAREHLRLREGLGQLDHRPSDHGRRRAKRAADIAAHHPWQPRLTPRRLRAASPNPLASVPPQSILGACRTLAPSTPRLCCTRGCAPTTGWSSRTTPPARACSSPLRSTGC